MKNYFLIKGCLFSPDVHINEIESILNLIETKYFLLQFENFPTYLYN